MSETADFYTSWLGCSAFGAVSSRKITVAPPVVFKPTDLSNCSVWFDANNGDSIITDPFGGYVTNWSNLGTSGGEALNADTSNVVNTGVDTINSLNVLKFNPYSALVFNWGKVSNTATTFFIVVKPITDLSSINNVQFDLWAPYGYNGYWGMAYAYSTGFSPTPWLSVGVSSGYTVTVCGGNNINPTGNGTLLMLRADATDLSNNKAEYNGTNMSLVFNAIDYYNQSKITYWIGNTGTSWEYDVAEIIIYDSVLTDTEVATVTTYLKDKWAIT